MALKINYGTKIYSSLLSFSANRFEISASIVKWQLDETSQIFVGHPVYPHDSNLFRAVVTVTPHVSHPFLYAPVTTA